MNNLTLSGAQRLATLLAGSIKAIAFYPAGHPAVKQPLEEMHVAFSGLLQDQEEIRFGLHDDLFFIDEHLFLTPAPSVRELTDRFIEKKLQGITFKRGLQPADLGRFVALLAQKHLNGKEMATVLAREGIRSVSLTSPEEGEDDTELDALGTYSQALEAIRDVFNDIEMGRIPSSGKVLTVVKNLVTFTIQDPSTLLGLAMIKDYDNYTFNHSVNVGILSMSLAAALGLAQDEIEELGVAGFLHDIGKTKIDKKIINKPGKLSTEEFDEIKKHSEIGASIISTMDGIGPAISRAVLGHHLRYNLQGYPEWAKDQASSIMSNIIAVADCYDAVTTLRVYQRPMNPKAAIDLLHQLAGTDLDRNLVTCFVEMMGKYPVGTLVRLDTGEIAIVYRPNPANSDCPDVKILFDARSDLLESPQVVRLMDDEGNRYASIVAVVDPLVKNIEVGKYLN